MLVVEATIVENRLVAELRLPILEKSVKEGNATVPRCFDPLPLGSFVQVYGSDPMSCTQESKSIPPSAGADVENVERVAAAIGI
jgi:hypothetical protein